MHEFYNKPEAHPPFGLSDHNSILVSPKIRDPGTNKGKVIIKRDTRKSSKVAMGRFLGSIDWHALFSALYTCEDMWNLFCKAIHTGLHILMPFKRTQICSADAPWMTQKLKSLILKRQKAFNSRGSESSSFKHYRNLVNRVRKECRAEYYQSKIQNLKEEQPKQWWAEVKRLSGMKLQTNDLVNHIDIEDFSELSSKDQANLINTAFLEPLNQYKLASPLSYRNLEELSEIPTVSVERVRKALNGLNKHKACGPDEIPNWLLKDFSDILAQPITSIINASYKEQQLPKMWKTANVTPLPKTRLVQDLIKQLRPISLTPCLSKLAEEFIVTDYIKPAIIEVIDPNQYGVIPSSSTTMALISMLHNWILGTDGNGATVRSILFDYRKAFDYIDHSILVQKLCSLAIPTSVINWVINFLSDRLQRVKLANDYYSDWGSVPSGVPQGTKLGPWLFALMINDLKHGAPSYWKFVDDRTASEIVLKGRVSEAQGIVNEVTTWSNKNRVQLHPDKCKELRITFSKQPPTFDPLIINGNEIEVVKSAELLGVTISNDFTWNEHVDNVIKKVNKRIYFLIQLKRAKVPPKDLSLFYVTCIRSVMDYGVVSYFSSLPKYLKYEFTRVEKRAISIILPGYDYIAGLDKLGLSTVELHHQQLGERFFQSIETNKSHKLRQLLPMENINKYNLRNKHKYKVPVARTNRAKNSFILSMCG